jgi:hypothetical protein
MPKVEFRNSWRSDTSAGSGEARGMWRLKCSQKTSTFAKFQLSFALLFAATIFGQKESRAILSASIDFCRQKYRR